MVAMLWIRAGDVNSVFLLCSLPSQPLRGFSPGRGFDCTLISTYCAQASFCWLMILSDRMSLGQSVIGLRSNA